jgi:hypothetical protein
MKKFDDIIREAKVGPDDARMYREALLFLLEELRRDIKPTLTEEDIKNADSRVIAGVYWALQEKFDNGVLENILVKNPGILEVPEGKGVEELGIEHFKTLVDSKGYKKISGALVNLIVWNKDKNKPLAGWAKKTHGALKKWHDKE